MRIRISARQSDLARLQAYRVGEALKNVGATEVVYNFRASLGDLNQADPLWKMPEKGVFTEDFTRDLTEGTADLVVHSWKDLPTLPRPETEVVATLPRADARDLLLFRKDRMESLTARTAAAAGPQVLRILTSSPRRAYNLDEFLREHLPCGVRESGAAASGLTQRRIEFESVRGNIPTRLKKLMSQDVDGLIVAKAALDRLLVAPEAEFGEAQAVIRDVLSKTRFMVLPLSINPTAAAQGALAIEILKNRPEISALLAKLSCQDTFESVNLERKILASYGGGCHQKIGVTVLRRPYGEITFLRGLTDQGETLDRVALGPLREQQNAMVREQQNAMVRDSGIGSKRERAGDAKRERAGGLTPEQAPPLATKIFPAEGEEGSFFDREPLAAGELEGVLGKLAGAQGIWVSRENAWPQSYVPADDQIVWTAGVKTWRKLAARGIWVNGSAEGLGEQEPARLEALLQNQSQIFDWVKLSHEDAHRTSLSQLRNVATYRLRPKTGLPDLRDRTHFYWMSGSSFERAVALFPEIKNKHHTTGPGHTHQHLTQALGPDGQLDVALDLETWRKQMAQG